MGRHVERVRWAASMFAIVAVFGSASVIARERCVPPAGTSAIEFQSGGDTLRGFIDLPAGTGKHPVMMIVHGGAPTDVTVDSYFEDMRRAFRTAGIATLLWDKAGNGCSEGQYSSALPLQERATEVLAALAMLEQRNDIDPRRIGVWAHSQGGWVGPMAAVRSNDIALLIVVSGPGRDALSQGAYPSVGLLRGAGVSAEEAEKAYATLRRVLAVSRAGGTVEEALAATDGLQKYPALRSTYQMDEAGAKQLQSFLAAPEWSYTAEEFLRQIEQPTLAIWGKRDAVVDWRESVDIYRRAFQESGNRDLTIELFEDADHEMSASEPPTFVPGYLETMIRWLRVRGFAGVAR